MRAPVGTSLIFNSLLGAVAAFGHVVYPLVLALRTRRLVDPIPPTPLRWPAITVVIPAYRERSVIGWKIENLRDNGYAGRLEIVVVAEDEPTAAAARAAGVRVLASGERLGKSAALNLGVAAASGSIVVITDANNRLAPGALAALTRWFSDPDVGAVAGEKRVDDEAEGVYWRFESWLKRHESRTGHTIGLVGELAAFRREAYRPIPAGVMIDDLWIGLDIIEQGYRVVYEPDAAATESGNPSLRLDWERRTRNIAGLDSLMIRRWRDLVPGVGKPSVQLWGHRFVRSSIGPLAHALLLARAARSARRSTAAAVFVALHLAGIVGLLARARGRSAPQPARIAGQVLFLQLCALGGLVRFLRRDASAAWPKPERQAPPDRVAEAEPDRPVADSSG